ncbi:MAG TPA: hypothetical protein VHX62_07495 [Solirubrobacteraceae bacterium]|nr:hypothetical protein [Solirubrobacteraceae bacterium]
MSRFCPAARGVTAGARRVVPTALVAALAVMAAAAPASAGVANAGLPGPRHSDPIAGLRWGNYTGGQDEVFPAYRSATGRDRALLGLIALRPRMRWFGTWYSDAQAQRTIQEYIANVTGGDPNVMSQVAVFRLVPWEHAAWPPRGSRAGTS